MNHIIVGTAGHIDHGKTALVKALTGIDADRLKEEKQRGITIDIGFADLVVGDTHFGFVDVPGHERFVKNMLAGAHGLDLVMLVIAADESVMPQTREHFDICRLLQVKAGLVALTKADLVDEELLALAQAEVEEYVSGSFMEGAPIIPVSSRTFQGIDDLKAALLELAKTVVPKATTATPRLPVDRSFSIKGFGTVVTGTLIAGSFKTGDEIEVLPNGDRTRVRNLQVHGRNTDNALAGQRTAINLQGISMERAPRGSVLALAGRLRPTSMLDVHLELLESASRPLRHRSRVRVHHGTSEVMARVALIGATATERREEDSTTDAEALRPSQARASLPSLEPGSRDYVQLRLEEPIAALPGDRFIIRSYSPQVTIGGGVILDSHPAKHRLRDAEVRSALGRLTSARSTLEQAGVFLVLAGSAGMTASSLAARLGVTDGQIREIAKTLIETKQAVEVINAPLLLVSSEAFHRLLEGLQRLLAAHHKREPLSLGISREEVRERLFGMLAPEIFRAVITAAVADNRVVAERDVLRLASHKPALAGADAEKKLALENAFKTAGFQALTLDEAAASLKMESNLARKFYNLLASEQRIVRVADFVFHREMIEELKARVRSHKSISSKIDVSSFKDITGGLSRKHAIPLLEFLDRERITRRVGNEREIL